jgi:PAS domain S-box-containing protein/RHS repeat-associated protein
MTHEQNSAGSLNRKRRPAPNVTGEAGVISEVRDDLRALEAVVEGTARGTGQGFFRSLVRHLAEAIDVHYAVVAEFPKAPPHVRTLAFWERDRVGSNFEYDFTGTPCAEIVRGGLVHYPTGVSQLTPQATPLVERGIDSYMAVPFLDHAGGILGHLAVFDERPMPAEPRREFVFRIFAARASAEQERLQAEQRLRESEARYRHLFENAPIGYITVGTDLRILNVNRRMTEMLGYPVEELVGAVIHSFLPDTTAGKARSEEVHRRHVAGASVSGWELEMRRKDGRPLWIKLWMEGGRGEDGAILPARAIVLDITDRVGSIRNMVDYAGNLMNTVTYDGFGGIVSETGDGDRWKWTGRELDGETGLQYNRARYYDSRIGRWTSEDPIGFGSGDANLFAYSSPSYALRDLDTPISRGVCRVEVQSLHYSAVASARRRRRRGGVRPRRWSNTFWASSGSVTQRRRMICCRPRASAGNTTSPLLIFANSSTSVRGASPNPDRCIQPASVFHNT